MIRIGKSVVFNAEDPDQAAMLEHAGKRQNFSAYVKRLIYRDMVGTVVTEERQPEKGLMEGFV
mgnify:CR=1 FL=1